jgi:hypothetical protein
MKRKHLWVIGVILAVSAVLYPFPSKGFLYRNAEILEGRLSALKGASVVLFLDPSFYYKFKMTPADMVLAVSALGLKEETKASLRDPYIKRMQRGPMFWNFWWWRPHAGTAAKLYSGHRNGNNFYLLYNEESEVAYLYIQNT